MTDPRRPQRALASRWLTDPDFATAYSYLRPGGTPADRDLLGAPVAPGLVFAGEATWAEHPGTMHGAWFSGERAARLLTAPAPGRVVVVGAGLAGVGGRASAPRHGRGGHGARSGRGARGPGGHRALAGGSGAHRCAWLHGDVGNPVAEAAALAGVATSPSHWGAMATYVRGLGALHDDTLADAWRRSALTSTTPSRRRPEPAASRPRLGPLVRELLTAAGGDDVDRLVLDRWIIGIYENLYAAPIDDLSLVFSAEPFRLPGADLTLLGGLDHVVAELAAGLDVHLGVRVEHIERGPHTWTVRAGARTEEADAVVVTVPLGVLQAGRIAFDPPLPAPCAPRLDRLGAGVVTKVFFTFRDAFWSPSWAFATLGSPRPPFELWVDPSRLAGQPTLSRSPAPTPRSIERADEQTLLDLAEQTLVDARVG